MESTKKSYGKEDDEMLALIERSTKFENELKSRKTNIEIGNKKFSLGDNFFIGKVNKPRGSRRYPIYFGSEYKCIGLQPNVVLQNNLTDEIITLNGKQIIMASMENIKFENCWVIEKN